MAVGQVSRASGSSVWFVYANVRVVMFQAVLPFQLVDVQEDAHQLGDGENRMGVVELDRHAIGEALHGALVRARMSCRDALTQKYSCLSRSSRPMTVESLGYRTRERFSESFLSRTASS